MTIGSTYDYICDTTHAVFNGGFTLDEYPRYEGQPPIQQLPTIQTETTY